MKLLLQSIVIGIIIGLTVTALAVYVDTLPICQDPYCEYLKLKQ